MLSRKWVNRQDGEGPVRVAQWCCETWVEFGYGDYSDHSLSSPRVKPECVAEARLDPHVDEYRFAFFAKR
eukprot:14150883-Alexandrium_andersonii.AAC.1